MIDVHTHITVSAKSKNGVELAAKRTYLGAAGELLSVMDRKNLRAMVNLTGGYDEGLAWRIYGIGLPKSILEKVYNGNAVRLLELT